MNRIIQRRDFWISLAALLFLALMVRQHLPRHRRTAPADPAPDPRGSPLENARQTEETRGAPQAKPVQMDTNRLADLARRWRESDGRDPFGLPPAAARTPAPDPFAGLDQLRVSAVWRQPGRRLAVINRRVVAEGDSIAGFRIEHCEASAVWIAGRAASRRVPLPRSGAVSSFPPASPAPPQWASHSPP